MSPGEDTKIFSVTGKGFTAKLHRPRGTLFIELHFQSNMWSYWQGDALQPPDGFVSQSSHKQRVCSLRASDSQTIELSLSLTDSERIQIIPKVFPKLLCQSVSSSTACWGAAVTSCLIAPCILHSASSRRVSAWTLPRWRAALPRAWPPQTSAAGWGAGAASQQNLIWKIHWSRVSGHMLKTTVLLESVPTSSVHVLIVGINNRGKGLFCGIISSKF